GNYPGVFTNVDANTDPSTMLPFPVSVDPRALELGYSEAFNFGIQHELTPNTRFEISYVGNRGHHLTDTSLAWNQAPTSTFLRLAQTVPFLQTYYPYVCSPADAAAYGVAYPNFPPGVAPFCGPLLAAIAPLPHMA